MRTKTDIRFVVETDPANVLDALVAVEMLPEWSPIYQDARVATRDELGRPRRVFVTAELMGSSDLQVLEYDWNDHRVSWTVTDSTRGAKGSGWFEVSEGDEGAAVWYHVEQYVPIPVPGILIKRSMRKSHEIAVQNFIEFAEGYPRAESYETNSV